MTSVKFESNKNAGKIETRIEVLEDKSSHVDESAPGEIYQNVNIWVGKSGFDKNIKNASINFKVEKEWIENNNINKSSVKMYRYHKDTWEMLQTEKLGDDKEFIKYRAKTPRFSPFAITAEKDENTVDGSKNVSKNESNTLQNKNQSLNENKTTDEEENGSIPGFTSLLTTGIIVATYLVLRKRD